MKGLGVRLMEACWVWGSGICIGDLEIRVIGKKKNSTAKGVWGLRMYSDVF
jgi:hypothetical protein